MTTSLMQREVREIPEAVARLLDRGGPAIRKAAQAARDRDPAFIATVARGSSDHACSYLKYAAELTLGLPVASIGPSVASIYGAKLKLGGALCLAVSQSGKSPDIVELTRAARAAGALAVAVTNDPASPLALAAEAVLDIHAGPELSVAATKTFVTSAVAGLALIAEWAGDAPLLAAIAALPDRLEAATRADWSPLADVMCEVGSLYTIGRGPSFAISGEAALKFKETCRIHAESYSSAEVLHGPVSIVEDDFPVLAFAAADAAETAVVEIAEAMAGKGARVFVTSGLVRRATALPAVRTNHPLTDPLALIVSFYAMVEAVARARGIDPDTPRHLKKVTETI
ncbi:SIS domain-containing protein [Albidovulum sediminis]|uniref:SIS domain-containing protein n=1 Tax=Albidovulum sediminis TaxID=3066345 RepID=A0ABT2NL55_9RHOB|nr:SIS domain-containing protein [Defluviimonas sediminis]MCT8328828.1 SIS domain-containing protein [Defluviimonas sediminis]